MLSDAAQLATVVTSISILIALVQLIREMRAQNMKSFFYLHEYLSQSEFGDSRREVRTRLYRLPYEQWTEEDKAHANTVCASYDQAGILIKAGVINNRTKAAFLKSSWGQSIIDQYEALGEYLAAQQTPTQTGYEFFVHFGELYKEVKAYRAA